MRQGTTWSSKYDATANSRPFSVASPRPYTPSIGINLQSDEIPSRATDEDFGIRDLQSALLNPEPTSVTKPQIRRTSPRSVASVFLTSSSTRIIPTKGIIPARMMMGSKE